MIDAIKKALLAGVGAAAITTDRAEKVLNELVEKGKISANDAREAAQKIANDGRREFEDASKSLEARFNEMLAKVGKGNSDRIRALEAQVAALEGRLSEMERERATAASASINTTPAP